MTPRRDYGAGSLYQRSSDGRWIGVVGETFNTEGNRKRITVSGKGCLPKCAPRCPHRADIKRKLERRRAEHLAAALLLEAGVPEQDVADLLGRDGRPRRV